MQGLSHTMVKELRDAFLICDQDGDGEINYADLSKTFKALGLDRSDNEIKGILKNIDSDNNGTVTFPEFIVMMAKCLGKYETNRRHFIKTFNLFDSQEEGFISKTDLQRINAALGNVMSEKEAQKFLETVDVNKDHKVDLEEFISLLTAGIPKKT